MIIIKLSKCLLSFHSAYPHDTQHIISFGANICPLTEHHNQCFMGLLMKVFHTEPKYMALEVRTTFLSHREKVCEILLLLLILSSIDSVFSKKDAKTHMQNTGSVGSF
jgi:hypothetical protein